MSKNPEFISPIAIDLGAKNTGVYFAHYKAGATPDQIKKEGKVYQIEKDKYTLLMQNRTAARHQKRGYDRRQMVKRLFKLIWCKEFGLEWNNDIQQTISFLFNRRGFTFLTEEHDPEVLKNFPKEIFDEEFPQKLKEDLKEDLKIVNKNGDGDIYDFTDALDKLSIDKDRLEGIFTQIENKNKEIKNEQFVTSRFKKLKQYYELKSNNKEITEEKKDKVKLSELPEWVLSRWVERGLKGLDSNILRKYTKDKKVDIVKYINEEVSSQTAKNLLNSIPSDILKTEKNLKKSIWNFNIEKFNMEKANFEKPETHLHHLAFVLDKIKKELDSGARHRKKYFEEIKNVLKHQYTDKDPKYLKNFCDKIKSEQYKIKNGTSLTVEELCNLIGHLSNFELKLLRSYFNSKEYKEEDLWNKQRLKKRFKHWILNIWRVNPQKDKDKADEKDYSYKKLRKDVKNIQNVIDFFLKTDPCWTIPPYQDNNNRRPPKCQSLILNTKYLDRYYQDWERWLDKLKDISEGYLQNYEQDIKTLKSGKGKRYFEGKLDGVKKNTEKRDNKNLRARVMQFIFDRSQKDDDLKLNKIFSYTKKIKQNKRDNKPIEEEKKKLASVLENSKLPKDLKIAPDFKTNDIFPQNSFLHLICKYYKLRQKAREGRLFIHPKYHYRKGRGYENTRRFNDKNHLLTYCNHKPRQKKYQLFYDLSSVLQISPKQLKEKIKSAESDAVFKWLKEIRGLSNICNKIAKQQKNRRGRLNLDIQMVYGAVKDRSDKRLIEENLKELESQDKVKKPSEIYDCYKKSNEFYIKILDKLQHNKQSIIEERLKGNPSSAFYLLAQLNNIAFKDRNGNAKTCAVCSADNAKRMECESESKQFNVKASRLPAITTRVIDGAVMRMARIVGNAIAEDKWETIEEELSKGAKVHIPIITESNQFKFEPSREELVKGQRIQKREGEALKKGAEPDIFTDKEKRIEESNPNNICPYNGRRLISGQGEIDHIIPRRSEWGALNDEANLIWTSCIGNQHKSNKELSLSSLKPEYKESIFQTKDDNKIKKCIIDKIDNGEKEGFKFGKYNSFINLNSDEQKAFRHALFLIGEPIRAKVIKAIDNRNRSLVNGTQRYFAQVLADQLFKKMLALKKDRKINIANLSFDYFSAPSDESFDSVPGIRRRLENKKIDQLGKYKKKKSQEQDSYSHLIDAQIAFMIAVSNHYKNGNLKINAKHIDVYANTYIDADNEGHKLYEEIRVREHDCREGELCRRKPCTEVSEKTTYHRPLFNANATAMHFLKLIEINFNLKKNEPIFLLGFLDIKKLKEILNDSKNNLEEDSKNDLKENLIKKYCEELNCEELKYAKEINNNSSDCIKNLYFDKFKIVKKETIGTTVIENYGKNKACVRVYSLNKSKVFNFLIDNFNTSLQSIDKVHLPILETLCKLWYFTKRKNVLDEKNEFKNPGEKKFKYSGLLNPQLKYEWETLEKQINESDEEDKSKVVKEYFLNNHKKLSTHQKNKLPAHQKVRKTFSLPIRFERGFLIRKRNWRGKDVFYCRPASNDFSMTLLHSGSQSNRLSMLYRKRNIFYIPKNYNELEKVLKPIEVDSVIVPSKYYEKEIPEDLKKYINKIQCKRAGKDRSSFKIYLNSNNRMDFKIFKAFIKKYPFREFQGRNVDDRKEILKLKSTKELSNKKDELSKKIKELESSNKDKEKVKKDKELLKSLDIFYGLWDKSQKQPVLEGVVNLKFDPADLKKE